MDLQVVADEVNEEEKQEQTTAFKYYKYFISFCLFHIYFIFILSCSTHFSQAFPPIKDWPCFYNLFLYYSVSHSYTLTQAPTLIYRCIDSKMYIHEPLTFIMWFVFLTYIIVHCTCTIYSTCINIHLLKPKYNIQTCTETHTKLTLPGTLFLLFFFPFFLFFFVYNFFIFKM